MSLCAIILGSAAERAPQPATRYFAGGRAPMLFIRRPNFFRRAFLWLLVMLAAPLGAPAATLEESARELARKIAGSLSAQDKMVLEVRNMGSLSWNEVALVETALTGELQNHVGMASTEGEETARVAVTLSENIRELVWTAEIRQGDTFRTILFTAPRPSGNQPVSGAMPVVLHAEKFWEGAERPLDASFYSDDNGENLIALLMPDRVMLQKVGGEILFKVEIPIDHIVPREPGGLLAHLGNGLLLGVDGQVCSIDLDTRAIIECHSARGPVGARDPVELISATEIFIPPGKGGQFAKIRNECSGTDLFLLTGLGDDRQPDSVQAFQGRAAGGTPASAELYLPGPVMALHYLSEAPRAIVRNLKSGNYEAYRLSISCGQ